MYAGEHETKAYANANKEEEETYYWRATQKKNTHAHTQAQRIICATKCCTNYFTRVFLRIPPNATIPLNGASVLRVCARVYSTAPHLRLSFGRTRQEWRTALTSCK